jgi:alkanesulfonate monooxygenase SsuD/methylene tetrahydromethanopterin reductase-like flavin-dependent oxidoreductase (luciferase family)
VPDYGHDLWFVAGINSPSQDASRVVELTELADRVGLDLAAFMDHPYQPAYLDTWTLLSYVAARNHPDPTGFERAPGADATAGRAGP